MGIFVGSGFCFFLFVRLFPLPPSVLSAALSFFPNIASVPKLLVFKHPHVLSKYTPNKKAVLLFIWKTPPQIVFNPLSLTSCSPRKRKLSNIFCLNNMHALECQQIPQEWKNSYSSEEALFQMPQRWTFDSMLEEDELYWIYHICSSRNAKCQLTQKHLWTMITQYALISFKEQLLPIGGPESCQLNKKWNSSSEFFLFYLMKMSLK